MSNVLNEEKKQQVIALGRLGWSLRKIQKATGIHRTTAADYLRAATQAAAGCFESAQARAKEQKGIEIKIGATTMRSILWLPLMLPEPAVKQAAMAALLLIPL